ncbi:hypothetical protein Agabi119p4_3012 [Agaricus bisporus var. burnettii]|uniref:Mediator complex subunit 16 C-terminal domain-containing protein n=1 Tax=Agaricus bisporus var. burnettii TaxID=192524 RepID=A0A8H7F696_AGABI|nr:hypothetical protein Agabi119p4_3012 [Agaricus bisporus var. burnettii]
MSPPPPTSSSPPPTLSQLPSPPMLLPPSSLSRPRTTPSLPIFQRTLEWWSFSSQSAPIAADWLGARREWAIDSHGKPERLPPRGFALPTPSPTLILVTQDYRIHICYYQFYVPTLQILKCPLDSINMFRCNQVPVEDEPPDLVKVCLEAAITMTYQPMDPIFIAARVRRSTASPTRSNPFDPMDLTVPVVSQGDDQKAHEWDSRNDECIVEISQVFLRFDGATMAIFSQPLTPIPVNSPGLLKLDFLNCPTNTPLPGPVSPTKKPVLDKWKLYLAMSFLDFDGYVSTPKSQLSIYSINRRTSAANKPTFGYQLEATRTFAPNVLTYVASNSPHIREQLLPVILLDVSGQWTNTTPKKPQEVAAGKVHMLTLPGLENKSDWEPSVIYTPVDSAGTNLPLQAISSPNGVLICTTSLSSPQPLTGIHLLPLRRSSENPPLLNPLAIAILNRKTPTDICHCLSLSAVPLEEVVSTLKGTMTLLDNHNNGLKYGFTWDLLGVAVEIYRKRASFAKDDETKECLTAKWHTGQDMCSVAASNVVFGNCANGSAYDLEAAWQLIGLSKWIITLLEKIMKECILFCDVPETPRMKATQDTASDTWYISPTLLHLIHPFALQNLITALRHVKKYYQFLKSLSARVETSQIAKDVLTDMIDYSGLNLEGLEGILESSLRNVESLRPEDYRTALAACQPTQALWPHLSMIVKKITETPNMINKMTLFIKPGDLVDDVINLNIGTGTASKQQNEDIVTKGVMPTQSPHLTCLRCGGSSVAVSTSSLAESTSDQWKVWEKMWALKCVCGGSWISAT